MNNSLNVLEKAITNKSKIMVNYGKDSLGKKDIIEPAYWDDKKNTFISETGVWDLKLLYEIARGEVVEASIEEWHDEC